MATTRLEKLIEQVARLDEEELRQLEAHIQARRKKAEAKARAEALSHAFAELREGLTEEQIELAVAAMNEEYIEPVDDDLWKE